MIESEESAEDGGDLIWLKWRADDDGSLRIMETREREGELVRERRDAGSLDAAAGRYGEDFRELVEKILESGSRQGRYRP